MATVKAVYQGALDEAASAGLRRGERPAQAHAWATAILRYIGYGEPDRPDIVSGYRSPMRQAALLDRWKAGDREALAARPACRSWHTVRRAIDVEDDVRAFPAYRDLLLRYTGARWGGQWDPPDPPHFDWPIGERPPNICSEKA